MKKLHLKKLRPKARSFLLAVTLCILTVAPLLAKSIHEITLLETVQSTVTGNISDENGVPLSGASVVSISDTALM